MRIFTKNNVYRYGCAFFCLMSAIMFSTLFGVYYQHSYALSTYTTDCLIADSWSRVGMHCIWYWMGGIGTLLFIVSLFIGAYGFFAQWSLRHEWDRLAAFLLVIAGICGLSFIYRVDCIQGFVPGGMVGCMVGTAVEWMVGPRVVAFVLYHLVVCALIVSVRFFHVGAVQTLMQGVWWLRQKRIMQYGYTGICWFIALLYKAVCACNKRWIDLVQGTLFERVSLTLPSDDEFHTQKLQELYKTLHEVQLADTDDDAPEHLTPASDEIYTTALRDDTETSEIQSAPSSSMQRKDRAAQRSSYALPNLAHMLDRYDYASDAALTHELQARAVLLQEKLQRFGVSGTVTAIKRGPVVTLYEYKPSMDTKISKIIALEDDLALALQALSIRIIAPIPGREVVGFEVSNTTVQPVMLASVFASNAWKKSNYTLSLALGVDTAGESVVVDLASMPHLLIAGSTGSGKSVALNTMLVSLICRATPDDVKLILIDPKRLEFASYTDIPHLLFPIVTDPRKATPVLRWVISEMEARYEQMALVGVRTTKEYNRLVATTQAQKKLPYIVVVIDELSDLMMTTGRDVEDAIARLAQMARAAGIHLIVATQRPSVDVITGLIKVNFPSRLSFRVTSRIDSRTILDCGGAEKLLGRGDMLFLDSNAALLRRLHGAYIADDDIQTIVSHIRAQRSPAYLDLAVHEGMVEQDEERDLLHQEVLNYINEIDEISISLLQRKFRIGFNRSARIIDYLEKQGRVMPPEGSKPRKVIH